MAGIETSTITAKDGGDLTIKEEGGTTLITIKDGAEGPQMEGAVKIKESAAAPGDTAAYGQLWVKNDTPNDLYFVNDAGTEVRITNGSSIAAAAGASVAADDIDAGDNNVSITGGSGHSLTLNATGAQAQLKTTTSGEVDITSAANIDINATTGIAIDATTVSIDGTDDSNLTVTGSGKDLDIAVAGGSTQELRLASAGTGAAAIHLNASAGGIDIDSADMIDIDAADEITIDTTSADGHIAITSAHTAGDAILISANANAGSILDIDAGILDVDIQAEATIDAVGIALGAGSGELDLTTTGTLDINANSLDMDLTDSSSITITSSEAAEDLTIEQVGSNDSSIVIQAAGTGTDAILLKATGGSIDIDSADNVTIDASDDIALTTGTADGLITIHSAHTAGQAILIDANADAGSILDVDAGILDVDIQGAATVDAASLTITTDTATLTSANSTDPVVIIKNTTNDANGARLQLVKDKGAAGAANDVNGLIQFIGDDANQDQVTFSEIKSQVKVHTNGQEGGKFTISVAEHDGTSTAGLVIEDGNADGELDVTIGAGVDSVTAISGDLSLNHDSATIFFGADSDISLTHDPDRGLILEQDTDAAGEPVFTMKSTGDFTTGAVFEFELDNSSGEADDDAIGTIRWMSRDSGNNDTTYAKLQARSSDITDGDEAGKIELNVIAGGTAGTPAQHILLSVGGEDLANSTNCAVHVNEASIDCDFIVESNDETRMLFVDAANNRISVGDSTDAPAATLEITNNASAGAFNVPLLQLNSNDVDQVALDINAANTTANIIDIVSDDVLTTGNIVHVDVNNGTTSALTPVYNHYDFDKDGVTGDGVTQTFKMFDIDMNDNATNHANSAVIMTGMSVDVVSSNAQGSLQNKGLVVTCSGADKNNGVEITAGTHIKMFNPSDSNDFAEFEVGSEGKLAIKTTDSTSNAAAHILLQPDGSVLIETATAPTVGGGFDGAAGSTPSIRVGEINGEIVTTVTVDIGGGSIVSSSDAGDAIGNNDEANAFLFQIDKAVNGVIYKAELICIEAPTTGDADINVSLHATAKAEDADAESGGHVIINGGTQVKGKFTEHDAAAIEAAAGGHQDFVHLTHGGTTAGTYDAGKLVVKLYGYLFQPLKIIFSLFSRL